MIKVYKGIKYYPTCSFEKNEHKVHYWYIKALNACYDSNFEDDKALEERDKAEKMLEYFQCYAHNDGLVYAPYKDSITIKEMIAMYDMCH